MTKTLDQLTFQKMHDHVAQWAGCVRCEIGKLAHKHVFARGTLPCDVLFLGEGPGRSEDLFGSPFVGRAGKLLNEWIESAQIDKEVDRYNAMSKTEQIKALFEPEKRFTYAVTNLVACRPCDYEGSPTRPPINDEVLNCRERLQQFVLQIAKPKVLVCLGKIATSYAPEWDGLRRLDLDDPVDVARKGGAGCPEDVAARRKLADFLEKM